MLSRFRLVTGLLAAAAVLTLPRAARADQKIISGNVTLGGDTTYDELVVKGGAKITVTSFSSGGGWLRIKANKITVEANASIDATGAGYQGQPGKDGQCAPGSMGCGLLGATLGVPGSGGGYGGLGGDGTSEATKGTCTSLGAASYGGQKFFDATTKQLALGSAGGSGNAPTLAPAGGYGGGGIQLSAAVVQIDGTLVAAGGKGGNINGVASGGGSGGSIEILAASLTGSGTLSVHGGDGDVGPGLANPKIDPNNGGGGAGGVILLHLPASAATGSITFDVGGGKNGDCGTSAGDGVKLVDPLPTNCVDVDGDNHYSMLCGGDDCDDSDAAVHPTAMEDCNGKDDDCDGKVDNGDLCSPGSECVMGTCTAIPDAGADGGGGDAGGEDAGPPPDHLEFGGGCSLPSSDPSALPVAGGGAVLLGLGIASLAASRPRRRRSRR
jgi:hypothetical protein